MNTDEQRHSIMPSAGGSIRWSIVSLKAGLPESNETLLLAILVLLSCQYPADPVYKALAVLIRVHPCPVLFSASPPLLVLSQIPKLQG
ncbi:MAG: hypothetical protein DMG06_23560 [Acidobacteria bacterium]|nr:MAG: hypothetical protein DMG06_23560 [Acidobacteriota bacterium]